MTVGERLELALLTVAAGLLTVLCCAFLMISVGPVPFPVTALLAGLGNFGLAWLAAQYTDSAWRFAPLALSGLVMFVAMMPIPGDFPGWITGLPMLLMLVFGLGLPASVAARLR